MERTGMRRLLLCILTLLPVTAFAQHVPNGGVIKNQNWTVDQWNHAWESKVDNIGGVCASCSLNNPTITAGSWNSPNLINPTFGSLATLSVTGATTLAGGATVTGGLTTNTLQSSTTTNQLAIKDGPGGANMLLIGGSSNDIQPQTNIKLPGGTWGTGTLANGLSPIFQNATFAGSTTSTAAAFGAFLQQTDNSSTGGGQAWGFLEHLIMNGSGATGTRTAGQFNLDIVATGNTVRQEHVGLGSKCNLMTSEGSNNSSCFGINPVGHIGPGVTAETVVGGEANTWIETGATVRDKFGWAVVDTLGSIQATADNIGITINNQYVPSSTVGHKVGLEFGKTSGYFPISTTGTLIYGQGIGGTTWTVANGIDWHLGTATGNWLNLGGVFTVDGGGAITATGLAISGDATIGGAVSVPAIGAGTLVSCIGVTSGNVLATAACSTGGTGGSGTVTSITAGTGLTGGNITGIGTIALANTAVTAGSYTAANITVNARGQITAASNGTTGGGTVTSVGGTGTVSGLTLTGSVTSAGSLTLGGTLAAPLGTATGNLAVSHLNSGTGASATTAWFGDGTWKTPAGGGTLTSLTCGAGLTGGTITGSGTCAVATTPKPIGWSADDTTVVHNYVQPLFKSPWTNAAPISSITYHVNATGSSGSFVASLQTCSGQSAGSYTGCTPVTGCNGITVSSATDTPSTCTGNLPGGQYLNLVITGTTGSPTSAWLQTVLAVPAT